MEGQAQGPFPDSATNPFSSSERRIPLDPHGDVRGFFAGSSAGRVMDQSIGLLGWRKQRDVVDTAPM